MTGPEVIQQIEAVGGVLTLNGDRIRYELPEDAAPLVDVLRLHRDEVFRLLRQRDCHCCVHGERASWWTRKDSSPVCGMCHPDPYQLAIQQAQKQGPPSIPAGLRLIAWTPKNAPVSITHCLVVNDVVQFIRVTLMQLQAALEGKIWLAGNWSVRDLVERLEQAGVRVEVMQ